MNKKNCPKMRQKQCFIVLGASKRAGIADGASGPFYFCSVLLAYNLYKYFVEIMEQ